MNVGWTATPGAHVVQFYEGERFLHRAIATFLTEAQRRGGPAVMIARPRTFEAVVARLAAETGTPLDPAGRILFIDAENALREFMDGLTPDPVRFERASSNLVAGVRRGGGSGTIWIYGEMVDVLCKAGNHAAAIQLEQMWNASFAGPEFSVMCGYAIEDFDKDVPGSQFRAVCRQHTHVIPAEGFTDAPDDRARFEQVARLQQRARALAHEPLAAATAHPIVYVIDDDVSVRRSLARLLDSIDVRVQTFASAEAFLAEVDRASTGCLILDVQLLGMSGSDLQTLMSGSDWTLPIIAMSGSYEQQIETVALRLGASAFLRKPFDVDALVHALALARAPR